MELRSYTDWQSVGRQVRRGEKSQHRDENDGALFEKSQTDPKLLPGRIGIDIWEAIGIDKLLKSSAADMCMLSAGSGKTASIAIHGVFEGKLQFTHGGALRLIRWSDGAVVGVRSWKSYSSPPGLDKRQDVPKQFDQKFPDPSAERDFKALTRPKPAVAAAERALCPVAFWGTTIAPMPNAWGRTS